MKYRRKGVVSAWAWDESKSTLEETGANCTSCTTHKDRPNWIGSIKIETTYRPYTAFRSSSVREGDFIVRHQSGVYEVFSPDEFNAKYECMEGLGE